MLALPRFVLNRLYIQSSLVNTPEGCEFSLRNRVGAGTLIGIGAVHVDGASLQGAAVTVLQHPAEFRAAGTLSGEAPLALRAGAAVTFRLDGQRLAPGRHSIRLELLSREVGSVEITVSDTVGEKKDAAPAAVARPAARSEDPVAAARPLRIVILGAGSTVFCRQLMTDILCTPGFETGTFVLVDIDKGRLELAHRIGEAMVKASGRSWTVETATARRKALRRCDYVINTIEVAGLRNVRHDYEIPLKYGVDQCIGDTIGPGGIFKMLRTGPSWQEIIADIEEICPRALVMNHTNPMSALTLLALRCSRLQVIGLCHSVPNTLEQLAAYLDLPEEELTWRCAGINHLAWFTELSHRGKDMYPRLAELARDPELYEADPVRFEVMKHFGAFVTESSGHLSEYLPYFRKRPDLIARYTRGGYRGESGYYTKNWPSWRQGGDDSIREILDGRSPLTLQRSGEFASIIMEGIECRGPRVVHGNLLNAGLIDNLPAAGCVEVAVLADAAGLHPVRFGSLPPQMAALDAAHMAVHELMVAAVLGRDLRAARHALLLDPLTAAVCSPEEIDAMFDEMVAAERRDLTAYRGA